MNKIKAKKWAKIAMAAVIASATIAGTVVGVGYGTGLFGGDGTGIDSTIDDGSGLVVGDSISSGNKMQIAKTTVGPTASAYTLTATITPSYATNPDITWSAAWDTTFSGYSSTGDSEDISGDGWIENISTVDISDYVTLSSTTGSSVTLTCKQAFGNPIIITATSDDDSSVTATCQLDYKQRVTGISLSGTGSVTLSSSSSSTKSIAYSVKTGVGTIAADFTVTYECDLWDDWFRDVLDDWLPNNGITTYSTSSEWKSYGYSVASSTSTSGTGTICSYSLNWTTFVKSLLASTTTLNDGHLSDFYNVMSNYANYGIQSSSVVFYSTTVSVTDNFTSSSYNASGSISLASLSDYPILSVTGIEFNETQVIF